ncbi:MAG: zinc ribbon domain-containing protein [Phycisphaerae bacterium]|nr:zinc ribbon domain-containing protein [Phycisphaerae bacterium]
MDQPSTPARNAQGNARAKALGADFSRLSAVEHAAQCGIGPLSELGKNVWHGEARPCISCGQLIRRTVGQCEHCGQVLSGDILQKMRQHSGPWYVLEHVRPFPGVSKERLLLQIQRGVLTATTIVRGPSTHHQWRFAVETPGLSKYLGLCWACQAPVRPEDNFCPICRKNLDSDGEEVLIEGDETLHQTKKELDELKAAVRSASPRQRVTGEPARIGGIPVWWVIAGLVVLLMAVVYFVARARENGQAHNTRNTADQVPLVLPDLPGVKPATAPESADPERGPAGSD